MAISFRPAAGAGSGDACGAGMSLLLRWRFVPLYLIVCAGAALHRLAGFMHPHQVWIREAEKRLFGYWAPGALEHLFGGASFLALLVFFMGRTGGMRSPRCVSRMVAIFALVYAIGSTVMWDGAALLAGDRNQIAQMIADVLAIGIVLYVARRPVRGG